MGTIHRPQDTGRQAGGEPERIPRGDVAKDAGLECTHHGSNQGIEGLRQLATTQSRCKTMNPLKRLNPDLSKLASQIVYAKHKELAERGVAALRATLARLIREGKTSDELARALQAADPDRLSISGNIQQN